MIRNSGLRNGNRFRIRNHDASPMDGMGNLADIMLVFACGLMTALILHWGVDLNKVVDIISQDELVEVHDVEKIIEGAEISNAYESKGMVYEDVKTGKLYIISP